MTTLHDETGTISVFWCITLTAFLMILIILIDASRLKMVSSTVKRDALLAINSQLADYNSEMYERYEILTLRDQDDFVIEDKIIDEMQSFKRTNNLCNYNLTGAELINSSYLSLANTTNLYNQISNIESDSSMQLSNMFYQDLFDIIEMIFDKDEEESSSISSVLTEEEYDEIDKEKYVDTRKENEEKTKEKLENSDEEDIVIDDLLLENLPSKYTNDDMTLNLESGINEKEKSQNILNNVLNVQTSNNQINSYIINHFNSYINKYDEEEKEEVDKKDSTFFDYEIEYIIAGKKSQNENIKSIKNKIFSLRLLPNIYNIYTNSEKMAELELTAQVLVGWWGTEVAVTILKNLLVISEAMLCSSNDVEKLINGEKVLLINGSEATINYMDCLKILLWLTNDNQKLRRINDVIYLNMNIIYPCFVIENARVGIDLDVYFNTELMFVDKFFNNYKFDNERKIEVCLKY